MEPGRIRGKRRFSLLKVILYSSRPLSENRLAFEKNLYLYSATSGKQKPQRSFNRTANSGATAFVTSTLSSTEHFTYTGNNSNTVEDLLVGDFLVPQHNSTSSTHADFFVGDVDIPPRVLIHSPSTAESKSVELLEESKSTDGIKLLQHAYNLHTVSLRSTSTEEPMTTELSKEDSDEFAGEVQVPWVLSTKHAIHNGTALTNFTNSKSLVTQAVFEASTNIADIVMGPSQTKSVNESTTELAKEAMNNSTTPLTEFDARPIPFSVDPTSLNELTTELKGEEGLQLIVLGEVELDPSNETRTSTENPMSSTDDLSTELNSAEKEEVEVLSLEVGMKKQWDDMQFFLDTVHRLIHLTVDNLEFRIPDETEHMSSDY
ncbi:hypothetical protein CAPTEDRAFT_189320 [Capitella teleta]|uniref:Uncharacterized protein n=1 Tax=Capitella teleta TaxID=283909 RepID=R7UKR7_CAPTE|nr:hypothetical protein CAPTEDRAFT_189320 [Capitella teleta]|eukprot:ELU06688.1 hypothetical protein CAPTEDRAFT_189320 [Capitella teleta]